MRYIIDTQAFIWYAVGNEKLSKNALAIIESDATCHISIASIWEMAIKSSIGKLTFQQPFEELISMQISLNDYKVLGLEIPHVFQLSDLPLYHKDPFDRILIAQSKFENIPIISCDDYFNDYDVEVVW